MTDSGGRKTFDGGHPFSECDHCGAAFDLGVSYPVAVEDTPDGGVELYSFCDEHCKQAWAAD